MARVMRFFGPADVALTVALAVATFLVPMIGTSLVFVFVVVVVVVAVAVVAAPPLSSIVLSQGAVRLPISLAATSCACPVSPSPPLRKFLDEDAGADLIQGRENESLLCSNRVSIHVRTCVFFNGVAERMT